MNDYGWLLDPKRCIECSACESACKQWNNVETGVNVRYRKVRLQEFGVFPHARVQALSIACNHCENAYCVSVCPVKAISRRADGIVVVDTNRCVGCTLCGMFCPYDAPQYHAVTRKMQKCTMCADRVDEGLTPACASACPTGALQWGKWDDIAAQGAAAIEGFSPYQVAPRIRFVTAGWGGK